MELSQHSSTPKRDPKFIVPIRVNESTINFELDTGASVAMIPKSLCPPSVKLRPPSSRLKTASHHYLNIIGEAFVNVSCNGHSKKLKLFVNHDDHLGPLLGPSCIRALFGIKFLDHFPNAREVHKVYQASEIPTSIQNFIDEYQDSFFKPGLCLMKHIEANFELQPGARPKFCKPRIVPFAIQDKVAQTLDRMEREGQLAKVSYSEWGTPVVPVVKTDQSICICGDSK